MNVRCPLCLFGFEKRRRAFGRCPKCKKAIRFEWKETEEERRTRLEKARGPEKKRLERARKVARRRKQRAKIRPLHSEQYLTYLDSDKWREIRGLILRRDGLRCRCCRTQTQLHVHHVHYRSLGIETGEELVTLCRRCHAREHETELRESERRWRGRLHAVRPGKSSASSPVRRTG